MATIRIPTPLRPYADGQTTIEVSGRSVSDVLTDLATRYPDLQDQLFDGSQLRSFINVYVNKEDIRSLDGPNTAVAEEDALMIVPSIAGGGGS